MDRPHSQIAQLMDEWRTEESTTISGASSSRIVPMRAQWLRGRAGSNFVRP